MKGNFFRFNFYYVLSLLFLLVFAFEAESEQRRNEVQELNIYFGGLHSHTSISDGELMPEDAFRYARDVAGVDFWAVTDHWYAFDTSGAIGFQAVDSKSNGQKTQGTKRGNSENFRILKEHAKKESIPGKFVAIGGFEWGITEHINVFNTDTKLKLSEWMQLKSFYNWLRKNPDAVAMFNHPGEGGTPVWDDFKYYKDLDSIINCIEVINATAGSYEDFVDFYFMALDAGWHLGPAASEDSHHSFWGTRCECRTAIFAEELSEESILNALRNHNFYATADKNLRLYFLGNNNLMGSKIALKRGENINFYIKVVEPDGEVVSRIAILSNNKTLIKEFENDKSQFEIIFSIPFESVGEEAKYYIVEVSLQSSKKAISSPIWITPLN